MPVIVEKPISATVPVLVVIPRVPVDDCDNVTVPLSADETPVTVVLDKTPGPLTP